MNTNKPSNPSFNNEISFIDLVRLLFFYKWAIFSIILLSIGISLYITWSTTPVYNASVDILIEKKSKAENIFQFSEDDSREISNELQILDSRTLADEVVRELWDSKYRNNLFLFDTKVFYPRGQRVREFLKKIISFGFWEHEMELPQNHKTTSDITLIKKYSSKIRKNISVSNKRGTKLIKIKYSNPNPQEAALIANTIANVYRRIDQEWISNESQGLVKFLNEQIDLKSKELEYAEIQLKKFKVENKIFSIEASSSVLYSQSIEIERELNNTIVQLNINNKQIELTNSLLTREEQVLAKSLTNSLSSTLNALREEIITYQKELIKNITLYGENHEAVNLLQSKIDNLKIKLNNETVNFLDQGLSSLDPIEYRQTLISKLITFETEGDYLNSKIEEYELLLSTYNKKLLDLPKLQMEYARVEREFLVLSQSYKFMRSKLEDARISTASEIGKVRIIDEAVASPIPIKPDLIKNLLLGIFIGSILSGFGIYIREILDYTVKSIEYMERFSIPLLAIIPAIGREGSKHKSKKDNKMKSFKLLNGAKNLDNLQRRLITHESPKSPVSEAYRHLRTNLLYTQANKDSKNTIMVSSPGPGEGKTTTIINLAITFANLGKKTILIDSDLRKPVLHKVFNTEKDKGLTHYLCDTDSDIGLGDIIKNTEIQNLSLITCGLIPPNPSELLASEKMEKLICELESQYDIVLLDAPPIMAVTDAILLSKYVSKFILLVRVGVSDKGGTARSIESLNQVNTKVSGIVMNALDANNSSYYNNYYYYQNYYYYSSDE